MTTSQKTTLEPATSGATGHLADWLALLRIEDLDHHPLYTARCAKLTHNLLVGIADTLDP